MNAEDLYARVSARLPVTVERGVPELTHEVLAALNEWLSPEEAAELGAELPEELGDILLHAGGDGDLDREQFLEHLAARLDVDDDEAEQSAQAVLGAIREYLEPILPIEQLLSSLPPDLAQLMWA